MKELRNRLAEEFSDKEYAHAYVEDHLNTRLAAQIKALREQRGWTQEELAQRASMRQERISALENVDYGSWTMSTLRKLARAFDVSLNVVFEPFSDTIRAVVSLSQDRLRVESREEDLQRLRSGVLIDEAPRRLYGGFVQTSMLAPQAVEPASNDKRWGPSQLLVLAAA